jgi:hypothetical protein
MDAENPNTGAGIACPPQVPAVILQVMEEHVNTLSIDCSTKKIEQSQQGTVAL